MRDDNRTGNPAAGEQGKSPRQGVDAMTNHQIINEMEQLFSANSDHLDTEKLGEYLDVLQERDPVTEDIDPESMWKELVASNPFLFEGTSDEPAPACQSEHSSAKRIRFRRLIGSVAAAAVLICMMTVVISASFRAWIRETYEGSVIYRFFNEETSDPLPDYEITNLPEGYVLISSECDENLGMKLYAFKDMQISFMFFRSESNKNFLIFLENNPEYQHTTVTLNNFSADLYTSQKDNVPNELVWLDEHTNMVFQLSGFLDTNTLIELAKSVMPV